MTVYKAGRHGSRYQERIESCIADVCWEAGDRDVFVDGRGPYCIVIDREAFKYDEGDRGVNSSTLQACWLKRDCIEAERGSILESGEDTFQIRGTPVDQFDGWVCAELSLHCESC